MRLRGNLTKDFKLLMVSILNRHGDRAPISEQLYPKSQFVNSDFYPLGEGGLTNLGKQQLFSVGEALRKEYNSFLGPVYVPNEINVVSSDLPRTQMSVLALCAGLFQPIDKSQRWSEKLNWQPVPYLAIPHIFDTIIRGPRRDLHQKYFDIYHQTALKSDFNLDLLNKYAPELKLVKENTGFSKVIIRQIYDVYQNLTAEMSLGVPLPDWAKDVYPDRLNEIGAYEYALCTFTPEMRQYAGGALAKQIVTNFLNKISKTTKIKLFINSGHESTLGYQLQLLDVVDQKIPPLASYIVWELLESKSKYYVRVLYQDYLQKEPREIKFVTFEEFKSSMERFFPTWENPFFC